MNNSWNCELDSVSLSNKTTQFIYPIKKKSIIGFITDRNKNYVPKGFIDLLINKVFYDKIITNQFIVNCYTDQIILKSSLHYLSDLSKIEFEIDGYFLI